MSGDRRWCLPEKHQTGPAAGAWAGPAHCKLSSAVTLGPAPESASLGLFLWAHGVPRGGLRVSCLEPPPLTRDLETYRERPGGSFSVWALTSPPWLQAGTVTLSCLVSSRPVTLFYPLRRNPLTPDVLTEQQ